MLTMPVKPDGRPGMSNTFMIIRASLAMPWMFVMLSCVDRISKLAQILYTYGTSNTRIRSSDILFHMFYTWEGSRAHTHK